MSSINFSLTHYGYKYSRKQKQLNFGGRTMKQTVCKKYNDTACNPFAENQRMDFCMAKFYIDDAYEKRRIARKALKIVRECGFEGHMLQTSYFCAVAKQAVKDYRTAQRLSVKAYRKCMADIKITGYIGYK